MHGKNLGILPTSQAVSLAKQFGLDLIEINATANPPVCKITDLGKLLYEQKKNEGNNKPTSKLKEIDLSARIESNDFQTKINHAKEFLTDGHRVKFVLKFKNREMQHTEIGFEIINRVINELDKLGKPTSAPKLIGRNINLMILPNK